MTMKNPPHPGRLIKSACLEPLELSITEGARILGVARPTLSNVVNGQAAISPGMAIRLEKAFGSSADAWLRMQVAFDLAEARRRETETQESLAELQKLRSHRAAHLREVEGARAVVSGPMGPLKGASSFLRSRVRQHDEERQQLEAERAAIRRQRARILRRQRSTA